MIAFSFSFHTLDYQSFRDVFIEGIKERRKLKIFQRNREKEIGLHHHRRNKDEKRDNWIFGCA